MCLGEASNHSRVCPCLKKFYFEIDHFRTPCSTQHMGKWPGFHVMIITHNSATAETELKYLRTYESIIIQREASPTSQPLLSHHQPLYVTSRYKDLCYTWQHSPAPWHVVTWAAWPAASSERRWGVHKTKNKHFLRRLRLNFVLAAVLGLLCLLKYFK